MPAASTKTENKVSLDAGDPMKQILIVIEKKVRNLEKRKGKLDAYKEKQDSGVVLEKDQQVAVDKYNEVEQNLIFAMELQKQFATIGTDVEKFNKKQAKKERLERQATELKRVKEMLRVQNLLDSLGSEQVRSDFQKGRHGAVVLSEENLNQLDELYKLINPSREPNVDYQAQLNAAGDHVICLIDSREKEVVGTTYKALKELINDVSNCGYFERALKEENTEECGAEQEFVVVNRQELPEPDSVEVQSSLPPEVSDQQPEMAGTTETLNNIQDPDSFFSEAPTATQQDVSYQRQRPFQEIVSSVQGKFNFLQESTIDMESPHMDPAVVAAHPMPGRPQSRQTEGGISQTFTNSGFGDVHQQQQSSSLSQTTDNSQQSFSQPPVSALSGQQPSLTGQEFTSQSYGQNSDSLFSEDAISQKVIGQSVPDSKISQFEMPPQRPLPMPPKHDSKQQNSQSPESQGEKKFTMNPNAGVFQSQIYSASQSQTGDDEAQQNEQSDFQGNNYQSGSNFRGNQGGNAWRGRGGRGGDRGGMSNGYHGNRNTRGSGSSYGGSRGGSYQGYPPRDNYRPDGYQGYNGNYSGNGGGFKRGSQSRGGPRGAGRGGGGGAPRGGRGGNRGSSSGFGKPNQQAQQVS